MPKKKKALPKEKTQKQRFIEKAKELGVDPDKFDRVFRKIAPKLGDAGEFEKGTTRKNPRVKGVR